MLSGNLRDYLSQAGDGATTSMVHMISALDLVSADSPAVAASIVQEFSDQREGYLKLIASENFSSHAVQAAMGTLLTDKYAEGFPGHRFYAGCGNIDAIESLAVEEAKALFGAQHAYVQPHSGADANLCAFWAILNTRIQVPMLEEMGVTDPGKLSREDWDRIREACHNQRLLGLDYYSGGHLTHGYRQNISAQLFDAWSYSVDEETKLLDYDAIEERVKEVKPLILLAGYSAYPRKIDFRRMARIAHDNGAVLMVDMAHFAGLVAGGVFTDEYNPVPWADVVTSTTHKTLRGPRGGLVLCTEEFREAVDKGCPLVLGGPLGHVVAAKALCFIEARTDEFKRYAHTIVANCQDLALALKEEGVSVLTGGTDNHLLLVDVSSFGINGRQAESLLRDCGITLNRNALPFDKNGPWYTSGLRLGTAALTTLGMGEAEMKEIASIIAMVMRNARPAVINKGPNAGQLSKSRAKAPKEVVEEAKKRVAALLKAHPLYPDLDLDFLKERYL